MNDGVLAGTTAVTRQFGDFVAVDHVDLELRSGEVVGLLGANGAGKTTLIRLILGLLRQTSGNVELFGEPPSIRTRRRLGYVPQGLGLYTDLTVAENLEFGRAVFGRGGPLPSALDSVADQLVGELPLGVQRRVAFAAALAHDPDLLVLDEPTSGVDPLSRARLWETIRDASDAGAGVLVTTHYMDEAEECDRLVMMANGRVVAAGTSQEITDGARVTVVETERWADAFAALDAAGLASTLVGRTLRVPRVGPDQIRVALGPVPAALSDAPASLEERFFEIVSSSAPAGRR